MQVINFVTLPPLPVRYGVLRAKQKRSIFLTSSLLLSRFGKACTGDEREMAKNCASILSPRDIEVVMEGKETDQFWRLLGGKQPYSSSKAQLDPEHEPRLFQCSNAVGYFRLVYNYSTSMDT